MDIDIVLYGMYHKVHIPSSNAVGNPCVALGGCFLEPIRSGFIVACSSARKDEHTAGSGDKNLRICLMI